MQKGVLRMTKKLDYEKTLNETKEKLAKGENPFENKNKGKVLSDGEIEQLLDAISRGPVEEKEEKVDYSRKIKIYDFKRPDVLSLNNVKDMDIIFEKVAQSWSRFDCLKNESRPAVHVISVDQLRFIEFLRSLPSPTSLYTFNWDGYRCAFEIDPTIAFPLIGISSDKEKPFNRGFTEKEKKIVIKKVLNPFLNSLKKTVHTKNIFYDVTLPKPKLDKFFFENETYNCQKLDQDEMVCLITLECQFVDKNGSHEGTMNFCMEWKLAKRLSQLLRNEVIEKEENKEMNFEAIEDTKVNVEGSLGSTKMSLKDVKDLKVGSIIELDKLAGEPTDLIINGKKVGAAEVVVISNENFGLRIVELD